MDVNKRRVVDSLLWRALEVEASNRRAFVRDQCEGDREVENTVLRLLELAESQDQGRLDLSNPLFSENNPLREVVEHARSRLVLPVGAEVGRYRVVREIGRGGMGIVYLAERCDGHYDQQVALKLLPPGWATEDAVDRFERERQILATLLHPNIAHLVDGGVTADGRQYLVMEYVDGEPIDRYCDRLRLSLDQRLDLFCDVCAAVEHAHHNLIVHRDLKPSNAVVNSDGTAKLLDFGIAKLLAPLNTGRPKSRTGTLRLLTPEYSSPEQVLGQPISTSTDVYQLGLMLYELLCGQKAQATTGERPSEIEEIVCDRVPERPSTVAMRKRSADAATARRLTPTGLHRRLRGDLDSIVMKALRKEPEDRYASPRLLSDDIRRHLSQLPITVRQSDTRYRMRKFVKRNGTAVTSAGLMLTMLIGYAVTVSVQSRQLAIQNERVTQEARRAVRVRTFLGRLIAAAADRPLLDLAVERVPELDSDPSVKAEVQALLGDLNLGFERPEVALPLAEQSLAGRRSLYGDVSPETAESLGRLANALNALGRFDEAASTYELAIDTYRQLGLTGWQNPLIRALAKLEAARGDFSTASQRFAGVVANTRAEDGESIEALRGHPPSTVAVPVIFPGVHPHLRLARAIRELASLKMEWGHLQEAEDLATEALELDHLTPRYEPSLAETQFVLGSLRLLQGRRAEGHALLDEAIRRHWADQQKQTAVSARYHVRMAKAQAADEQWASAQHHLDIAFPVLADVRGPRHPEYADALHGLGLVELGLERPEAALTHLRQAEDIYTAAGREDHPRFGELLHRMGLALLALGEPKAAGASLHRAVRLLDRHLPAADPRLTAVRADLESLPFNEAPTRGR